MHQINLLNFIREFIVMNCNGKYFSVTGAQWNHLTSLLACDQIHHIYIKVGENQSTFVVFFQLQQMMMTRRIHLL